MSRLTLLALLATALVGVIAVPALALAGYRFLAGDGFSAVLGIGIALLALVVVTILVLIAARRR